MRWARMMSESLVRSREVSALGLGERRGAVGMRVVASNVDRVSSFRFLWLDLPGLRSRRLI